MDVVPADDHRYKFADNKWYVKHNTKHILKNFSLQKQTLLKFYT